MTDKKRPNILCFILDQLRSDHLGCAGNEIVKTPNIDAIARDGVMFSRAYAVNAVCSPVRATLFTGLMPRIHGLRTNGIPLSCDVPTMPQALADAGYRTHSVGKLHLSPSISADIPGVPRIGENYPEDKALWDTGVITKLPSPYYGLQTADFMNGHGSWAYGEYINWLKDEHPEVIPMLQKAAALESEYSAYDCWKMPMPDDLHYTRWISDKTIGFLEEQKDSDAPFFLWCSFPDPHHAYAAPRPWCDMYKPGDMPLTCVRRAGEIDDLPPMYQCEFDGQSDLAPSSMNTSDEHLKERVAMTYGMISYTDHEIGRIMAKLRGLGMADDTVIILLSDHGDMMGDHHMIKKGPVGFDGVTRIPFIWSWPGHFKQNAVTDGIASQIDFVPTILDLCGVRIGEGSVPDPSAAPGQLPALPGRSLVPQLIGQVEKVRDWAIIENDADFLGLRIRTFVTEKYKLTVYMGKDYGELFDLAADPDVLYNRWDDAGYQDIKKALKADFLDAYISQDSALPRRAGAWA